MASILLRGARVIATMNDARDEFEDADMLIKDGWIEAIGHGIQAGDAQVLDMSNQVVMPGLVNTHHHFFQSLTRAVPAAQNCELFDWLKTLYPIWSRIDPEMIHVSTQTAMTEMLLSGCTMSSDHLYLYPNGSRLDDSILAAKELGMRFHATRGAMSVGESKGGLPPDHLVEDEDFILKESERLIHAYHDPAPGALIRVGLAPCSPFTVSQELMKETAQLARHNGVMLHTHLAENDNDVAYSLERFGCTPTQYAEDAGWLGSDVWHAHCVKLDTHGINMFASTGTGVAHCPCSNMRLASGIAPVRQFLDAGVKTGLGVDGSASNDSGHLLSEARQAMLLQRVSGNPAAMSAREALFTATRGGAKVLGRTDTGYLAPGMAADIASFRIDGLPLAGAGHDPLAAMVFAQPGRAHYVLCHGEMLVDQGQLVRLDEMELARRHNVLATKLIQG